MEIRVFGDDTDATGSMYFANFLKYMERSKTELLESVGIDLLNLRNNGIVFVSRHAESEFVAPAFLGDQLLIRSAVVSVNRDSFDFVCEMRKQTRDLVFTGRVEFGCVSTNGTSQKMPMTTLERLRALVPYSTKAQRHHDKILARASHRY